MIAPTHLRLLLSLLATAPLWLASCRDPKVQSYRVAKDAQPPPPPAAPATSGNLPADHPPITPGAAAPAGTPMAGGGAMANTAVPTATGANLTWTAPAHWQAKAGSSMRKGTYVMSGDGGATAELAITAFPGDVGGEVANVNRWRGQIQLAPVSAAEAGAALQRLSVNGLTIAVLDIANPGLNPPVRMLGAMVPFANSTWFFKLTGADTLVAKEKPAFLAFIQTVKAATP
ncbi:MAG: hypothetical protein HZA93_01240 [Verrucomicrobia bacterium]|nr:hypothetical protein [Verrucomicrobiota bacterium]